jgi:hypothetical protein
MGFELDEDTVRAKYGEGWSKKVAAPPVPPLDTSQQVVDTKAGKPTNFSELNSRDALDHLVDDALGDWQP